MGLVLIMVFSASIAHAQSDTSDSPTSIYLPLILQQGESAEQNEWSIWNEWDVIPGTVLVEFTSEFSKELHNSTVTSAGISGLSLKPIEISVKQTIQSAGLSTPFISILPNTFIGEFDPAHRNQILDKLAHNQNVVTFEPDRIRIASSTWGTETPNDPFRDQLWGMNRIGAPQVWSQQSTTTAPVRVAVMESGRYDHNHPDLMAQHTLINHTGVITDHATHVAGIIAATGNNERDVVGVANVELVALQPSSRTSNFAQNISWAVNNNVRVINMSFKWCGNDGINNGEDCYKCLNPAPSTQEQNAIDSAARQGMAFVAAAGNDSCNLDSANRPPLPASYSWVIGVSALNQLDERAGFSNFGDYVDYTAPGVGIISTITGGQTANYQGTSMAAPHVSGAAAAILTLNPSLRRFNSWWTLLTLTAEDIGDAGKDDNFGYGVIRVDRAARAVADVYVRQAPDFVCNNITPKADGGPSLPYCNLSRALIHWPHNTVGLIAGEPFEVPTTISEPVTLISVGGVATLQ